MGFPALRSPRTQNTGANPGVDVVVVTPATLVRSRVLGTPVTPSAVVVYPLPLVRLRVASNASTTVVGRVKVYVSSAWTSKPLKVRVSGSWVTRVIKKRTGGSWSRYGDVYGDAY